MGNINYACVYMYMHVNVYIVIKNRLLIHNTLWICLRNMLMYMSLFRGSSIIIIYVAKNGKF